MILEGLKLKLAAVGAAAAIAALAGVTIWAYAERAGRLECKVELVRALDQVKVLAGTLERQGAAIDRLAGQTATAIARTGKVLDALDLEGKATRLTLAELELQLAAKTPANADGSAKGCADYLKEWRADP